MVNCTALILRLRMVGTTNREALTEGQVGEHRTKQELPPKLPRRQEGRLQRPPDKALLKTLIQTGQKHIQEDKNKSQALQWKI